MFRIALGAVLTGLLVVRIYHHLASRHAGPVRQFESSLNIALRVIAGLTGIFLLILHLVKPDWMAWASVCLPAWLRWTGVVLGVVGVLMLAWVHHELGRNFSGTLHLRTEHTLVTSGPYHWIRHPMYTAFFAITLSFFLLSANWLIGIVFLGGLIAVMISRVTKEEQVMATRFGAEYQTWATHTGRFLPRIHS